MGVSQTADEAKRVVIIEPPKGWALPDLREVWRYRAIIFNFVARNFSVAYRQTVGGPLYAVYNPFMAMLGYSVLLGSLARMPSEGIPYPVFSYSALIIWTLFTSAITDASNSLQINSALVQKIYIPRLLFPLVAVCMALLNFSIAFVVLLVMMPLFGVMPTANIIFMPFFVLLAVATALGVGLWFAGVQARMRDASYLVALITRGVFFLTPVVYSSRVLPAPWDTLYSLNPMAVVVEGFRWSLLGTGYVPQASQIAFASVFALVLLVLGALNFTRLQATVADVV